MRRPLALSCWKPSTTSCAMAARPLQVHNNCSGKHAGMLALSRQLGADPKDYVKIEHPVQQAIAKAIAEYCDVDVETLTWGIDGCSVPTWAFP